MRILFSEFQVSSDLSPTTNEQKRTHPAQRTSALGGLSLFRDTDHAAGIKPAESSGGAQLSRVYPPINPSRNKFREFGVRCQCSP